METLEIKIKGIVQGVGYRPYIYRTAILNNINGIVANTSQYVLINAQGNKSNIDMYLQLSH